MFEQITISNPIRRLALGWMRNRQQIPLTSYERLSTLEISPSMSAIISSLIARATEISQMTTSRYNLPNGAMRPCHPRLRPSYDHSLLLSSGLSSIDILSERSSLPSL